MDTTQRVQSLIEPALEALGYEVVLVRLTGSERPALKVTIDRLDGEGVGIDDCVSASREISAILDVEDPIESAFTLEVSSPGLERPLTKKTHFERFKGSFIKVQTHDPLEARKRFTGVIQEVRGESILLELVTLEGERTSADLTSVDIPLKAIAQARLAESHQSSRLPKSNR